MTTPTSAEGDPGQQQLQELHTALGRTLLTTAEPRRSNLYPFVYRRLRIPLSGHLVTIQHNPIGYHRDFRTAYAAAFQAEGREGDFRTYPPLEQERFDAVAYANAILKRQQGIFDLDFSEKGSDTPSAFLVVHIFRPCDLDPTSAFGDGALRSVDEAEGHINPTQPVILYPSGEVFQSITDRPLLQELVTTLPDREG